MPLERTREREDSIKNSTSEAPSTCHARHAPPGRWGVLLEEEIRSYKIIVVEEERLDDDRCYQSASYDLRLGDEYVLPDCRDSNQQITILSNREKRILEIPPFSSVVVSSYEKLDMPEFVVGRFDLRIRHAMEGLMVQMGTQIEPGYRGKLFALLHNISDQPRRIKFCDYDTRLFTVEFSYTSAGATVPKRKSVEKGLQDFLPADYVRGSFNAVIKKMEDTLGSISKAQLKVEADARQFNAIRIAWVTTAILGGVLAIMLSGFTIAIPFVINKFSYEKDDFPLVTADLLAKMTGTNIDSSLNDKVKAEIGRQLAEKLDTTSYPRSLSSSDELELRAAKHRLYLDLREILTRESEILGRNRAPQKQKIIIQDEIEHISRLINKD